MPAAFSTSKHDSEDINACGRKVYVLCITVLVDYTEIHDIDFGREGRHDEGGSEVRKLGGREGRRLVTGVRSGRVGTSFELNDNEVSRLPAGHRRVCTCVRDYQRSFG